MGIIYLLGLGPGGPGSLTLETYKILQKADRVYVRTARHPGARWLGNRGINYMSFDRYYKSSVSFEETYRRIARHVVGAARLCGKVAYAVPGSPFVGEKSVALILKLARQAGLQCRVIPAVSFIEAVAAELQLDRAERLVVADAMEPDKLTDYPDKHLLVMQAYNKITASVAKLALMKVYPHSHPVTAIKAAGTGRVKKVTVPLARMDHLGFIDHLTTFYIPPFTKHSIFDLLGVMQKLRSSEGCPWDREQDHRSLKPYLLEEAYEVIGAIDGGDKEELCTELGDLLLQIVFHAQIAAEEGYFSFADVAAAITEKLIRRHPHVFGKPEKKTAKEVLRSWQQIKQDEKKQEDKASIFTLEHYLPALLRAQKLQRQASSVGFDWPSLAGAWDKLTEELQELQNAYYSGDEARIEEEMGDLLFAVVNVARFLKVDAEQALAKGTEKFYRRLLYVENKASRGGKKMTDFSLSKLDEWWEEAKKHSEPLKNS